MIETINTVSGLQYKVRGECDVYWGRAEEKEVDLKNERFLVFDEDFDDYTSYSTEEEAMRHAKVDAETTDDIVYVVEILGHAQRAKPPVKYTKLRRK